VRMRLAAVLALAGLLLAGCGSRNPGAGQTAVYMLLDTSGTYADHLDKANRIINYLLVTLDSGDSLYVAGIDSSSFSQDNVWISTTFAGQPSKANQQKLAVREALNSHLDALKPSKNTDIKGGLLQAVQYLEESRAQRRMVLLFSDLAEDLPKGYVRDFPVALDGIDVVAVNVTKLASDNVNPEDYLNRLKRWKTFVTDNGGRWEVIQDMEHLDRRFQSL